MKITVSAIKADVGGIGGHTRPSDGLLDAVKSTVKGAGDRFQEMLWVQLDHYIGSVADSNAFHARCICRCQFLEYATLQCVYHPHSIRCNDPTAYLLPLSLWILLHPRDHHLVVCPPIPPTSAFIAETVIFIFCEIISPMIYV